MEARGEGGPKEFNTLKSISLQDQRHTRDHLKDQDLVQLFMHPGSRPASRMEMCYAAEAR